MDIYLIVEGVLTRLNNSERLKQCAAEFKKIAEAPDKVNYAEELLKHYGDIYKLEWCPEILVHMKKNDDKSLSFRNNGNNFFSLKNKNYFHAMHFYNKSLCFAKNGSENLSIAYANRSAILFEWKKYKECLENIRLAREANYPERLSHKLDKREKMCLELQQSEQKEEEFEFELTHEKHPIIPFISNCLDMKYDDRQGRYIYTKKNLLPGDIVAIEKPFCSVLLPSMRYIRCANCNIENYLSLIPCYKCTNTMFCSKECMKEGFDEFHKFECPISDFLYKTFNKIHLTALRVTLVALSSFDNVDECIQFCDNSENQNKDAFSINYENFNKKEYYRAIHGLVTNQEKRENPDLFQRAIVAAVLRHFLLKKTPLKNIIVNENQKSFLGSLLFKHLQTCPSNMHNVVLIEQKSENYNDQRFATAAYAFSSLLNHSCDPNVLKIYRNTTRYVYILRPIPAGGILYDNYGYHFAIQAKEYRQENLMSQYKFLCECQACTNDYPLFQKLPRTPEVPFAIPPWDFNTLLSYDKEFAKSNYRRYCNYLGEYDKHHPCAQTSSTAETLKLALNILNNAVPLKSIVEKL